MKTTPFTDVHIALGAKMHEFAGFNMPIEYTGIIDEHMTVVNGVGVFDVSHMGEFWVKGPNALAFIQSVTSNDASVLPIGKAEAATASQDLTEAEAHVRPPKRRSDYYPSSPASRNFLRVTKFHTMTIAVAPIFVMR